MEAMDVEEIQDPLLANCVQQSVVIWQTSNRGWLNNIVGEWLRNYGASLRQAASVLELPALGKRLSVQEPQVNRASRGRYNSGGYQAVGGPRSLRRSPDCRSPWSPPGGHLIAGAPWSLWRPPNRRSPTSLQRHRASGGQSTSGC